MKSQTNSTVDISLNKNYKISVDKFLNDKNISQLAKDLYVGKIRPADSDENLSLIDSINSKGQARAFYFLVITKTMEYADGSYAEPLGLAAKAFVEKNTTEFLSYFKDNSDILTNKDYENWARLVYGEIQIDSEGSEQKAVADLETKMIANSKGLLVDYKQKIEKYIRLMK